MERQKVLFVMVTLVLGAAAAAVMWRRAHSPRVRPWEGARVVALPAARAAVHAYGRAGDLVLHGSQGTSVTLAATEDAPGQRPLRGALVDLNVEGADAADPLLWFRVGWREANGRMHLPTAVRAEKYACASGSHGSEGFIIDSNADGVLLRSELCAEEGGVYRMTSAATRLPAGAVLADELHPGTAPPVIEGQGGEWEGEFDTRFVAFAEHGVAVSYEGPPMRAIRKPVHIAAEVFPAAVTLIHGAEAVIRTFRVGRGDALDAISQLSTATRSFTIHGPGPGTVTLLDAGGRALASGVLREALRLPPDFGTAIAVRDATGVVAGDPIALPVPGGGASLQVPEAAAGTVALRYVDDGERPLAAHVIVRGVQGTRDPEFPPAHRVYSRGPSLYLLDGRADVRLAPGRYSVIATHGITHTLARAEVEVHAGGAHSVSGVLRPVVKTDGWLSGDFHLHAAPSPDSAVSFEERLATLMCQGLDLAVATDHNHVSDYSEAAHRLGLDDLGTVVGDEITSYGSRLWGHFIAFPLKPSDPVIPYFDVPPQALFAGARAAGARVVQVNHARMPPSIGYFDQTHLDPRTGAADAEFSDAFDSMEVFNGVWLEDAARIREGARDLVAMARRGRRPAAMGNSDSHKMHYEEAGFPRTFVHAAREPGSTRLGRTIDAILAGDTFATSGPFVEFSVQRMPVGSTVRPDAHGKVDVHVRIQAPAWVPVEHVEIWRDDEVVERIAVEGPPVDGVRLDKHVEIAVARDATLLAWVDASAPLPPVVPYPHAQSVAITGLTLVDADGDGRVQIPAKGSRTP